MMESIVRSIAVLCLLIASFTSAYAQSCQNQAKATTPAGYSRPDRAAVFLNELRAITQQVRTDPHIDTILIGDSLIEGWDVRLLRPRTVINFGVGGDKTENVLFRLEQPLLKWLDPRNVILLVGTNNLAAGDDACSITRGIQRIAARLSEIWPRATVRFVEIPPRFDTATHNEVRLETNEQMRSMPSIKTVNVDAEMTCGGDPCAKYKDDKLHFSSVGYDALTRAIEATLE
jgi:platelet-activating factor acetylhydrolase IB subunit beta/gamma